MLFFRCLSYIIDMKDKFLNEIDNLKTKYILHADDYYKNATIIFRLIYEDEIFDRYYECINEFNRLKGGLYSDKHINRLLASKKNKSKLVKNILHSRAMGCLAIVDAIEKLEHNFKTMTESQISAYENLLKVRNKLVEIAKNSLDKANIIAQENNYQPFNFDVENKYPKL